MNKIVGFTFLAFALTGILMTTSMSETFAAKGGNGSENANTQSCENLKGQAPSKNPNCGGSTLDYDNDGISDADEIAAGNCLDPKNPDSDNDGWLDGVDAFPCDDTQN